MRKNVITIALLAMTFIMVLTACGPAVTATTVPPTSMPPTQPAAPATEVPATLPPAPTITPTPFIFGMLLVGAKNDNGWSEATF